MAISVRLDDHLVSTAKVHAEAENRSVPKQIEYWAKIGQIMIENPELSYGVVHESLLATQELNQGQTKSYVRRTTKG